MYILLKSLINVNYFNITYFHKVNNYQNLHGKILKYIKTKFGI